jgi:hypothetical protein
VAATSLSLSTNLIDPSPFLIDSYIASSNQCQELGGVRSELLDPLLAMPLNTDNSIANFSCLVSSVEVKLCCCFLVRKQHAGFYS